VGFLHDRGTWPVVSDVLLRGMPGGIIDATPLPPNVADQIERPRTVSLDLVLLPARRVAASSRLEPLFRCLRDHASAGPSAPASEAATETSETADLVIPIEDDRARRAARTGRDAASSDVPLLRCPITPKRRIPGMTWVTLGPCRSSAREHPLHEEVTDRIDMLMCALQPPETAECVGALGNTLLNFSENRIRSGRINEVPLADSILSLLAQTRSFRICRTTMLCPIEGDACKHGIRSIGTLALH
jgi:hypothetical protein